MNYHFKTRVRFVTFLAVALIVSSCATLPRVGPNKSEIMAGSVDKSGNAHIITVDERVSRLTNVQPALGFSNEFINAGKLGSDTINPGDKLSLTVWENVDEALFETRVTFLQEVQVDGDGFIFIPYAGRIHAADNSPEALRQIITRKLEDQTPEPQVEVRRVSGDGSTVSLIGAVSAQGIYPISRPTRTLSAMLASAGGIAIDPESAQITVIRGNHSSKIWFQDLFINPKYDIPLRDGDRILVEMDTRTFTALGASSAQARVPFKTHTLNAVEALATVGGLRSVTADPTGVFIMRDEPETTARLVLEDNAIQGDQRMVYVLNLTQPNGVFIARDFYLQDGDTMYITEAPFAQWSKVIGALTGTLGAIGSISTASDTLSGI